MKNTNQTPRITWMSDGKNKNYILFLNCGDLVIPVAAVDYYNGLYNLEVNENLLFVDSTSGEWTTLPTLITPSFKSIKDVSDYVTELFGVESVLPLFSAKYTVVLQEG